MKVSLVDVDQGNFREMVDVNPDDVFGPAKVLEKEVHISLHLAVYLAASRCTSLYLSD